MLSDFKATYGDNLLYIGLRGSRCLNVYTDQSDYDYLVVVKNGLDTSKFSQRDITVITEDQWTEMSRQIVFETVEATFNPLFCKTEFVETMETYNALLQSKRKEVTDLFHFQLFQMLKNQLKQVGKATTDERRNKFTAKSWLFYQMLQTENALNYYINRNLAELTEPYLQIKDGLLQVNLSEIADFRTDNLNRSLYHQKRLNALKGLA